jgi:hypothetical protein
MRRARSVLVVAGFFTAAGAAGCHATVQGALQMDGKTFPIAECRNGEALGFEGLEIADNTGWSMRLQPQANGSADVAVFSPGQIQGDDLGVCGGLAMSPEASTINDIPNMQGQATFSCSGGDHQVSGQISFQDCH